MKTSHTHSTKFKRYVIGINQITIWIVFFSFDYWKPEFSFHGWKEYGDLSGFACDGARGRI